MPYKKGTSNYTRNSGGSNPRKEKSTYNESNTKLNHTSLYNSNLKTLPSNQVSPPNSLQHVQMMQSNSFVNNLKEALTQGIGLGLGSSLATRLVDNIFGPKKIEVIHQDSQSNINNTGNYLPHKCEDKLKLFNECASKNHGLLNCESLHNDLQTCIKSL